jgi:hypothetical protein
MWSEPMVNDAPKSSRALKVSNFPDQSGEPWPVWETIRSTRLARDPDERAPKAGNVSLLAKGRLASFTRQAA